MKKLVMIFAVLGLVVSATGTLFAANWSESFDNNSLHQTWSWGSYPGTGSFGADIIDVAGNNDYLSLNDISVNGGGSDAGFGWVPGDSFSNVWVAATVNVAGDKWIDHSLMARASLFDFSGATVIGSAYAMLINWEGDGTPLRIEVNKIFNNTEAGGSAAVDATGYGGDGGASVGRSFYAVLSALGSSTVTVTGKLYDTPGGNLLATAIWTDTSGTYLSGVSGIYAEPDTNTNPYNATFDNVSSSIPEPGTLFLLGSGLLGLVGLARKKKRGLTI